MTVTIALMLLARQPLLFAKLQGDPNSRTSFGYIPGSVLRGALITRYRDSTAADLDMNDETVRRLFFDGNTCYLHGYPVSGGNAPQRMLPVPRSLMRFKIPLSDSPHAVFDLSLERPPHNDNPALKGVQGYAAITKESVELCEPDLQISVHNQRDRMRGRGVEGSGALFRYDALAAGNVFQAAVVCREPADADRLLELLQREATLWLGGSRSAGYGETQILAVTREQSWNEVGSPPGERTVGHRFRLTLLSDLFSRDGNGQPTSAPPLGLLQRELGLTELTLVKEHTFVAEHLHGGFNRSWGLPTPQAPALAAGSVLTLQADRAPDPATVAQLEWRGIGERRAEGFGRVVFEWPPASKQRDSRKGAGAQPTAAGITLGGESEELAREMARSWLDRKLETQLTARVSRLPITGPISNAQISRLRIVARNALGKAANERMNDITEYLANLPADSRMQYQRSRIDGQSLWGWLQNCVRYPDSGWTDSSATVAGVRFHIDEDRATRATLRLIMAVARRKSKETAQ